MQFVLRRVIDTFARPEPQVTAKGQRLIAVHLPKRNITFKAWIYIFFNLLNLKYVLDRFIKKFEIFFDSFMKNLKYFRQIYKKNLKYF
jgi:hypothetical protein